MRLIALKPVRVKTSKGPIEIQAGDVFNPVDSRPFIETGIAEPVSQETFKRKVSKLSEHLRQRDYDSQNFTKLHKLSLEMDKAWQAMDYPVFKKAIDRMMQIPGKLRAEGNKPVGAKMFSHILQDTVWVAIDPTFQANDGIPIYYPEEIRNLKGATLDEIQAVHKVKKELGGRLIAVNMKGEG